METVELSKAGMVVSRVVLGLMRIKQLSDGEIRELVGAARDAGVTMFDHADIYGGPHGCEQRYGDAQAVPASERDQIRIQSKVGIRAGFFDSSREHILASVEQSLAALRTEYLDLLLIHRPDTLVEPDEVAAAFDELHTSGKVLAFGVSNHTPGQIELLAKSVRQPLVVNQLQFSLANAALVAQGLAANITGLDQSADRDLGVLDYSRLNDITIQTWGSIQKPPPGGVFLGDHENYGPLNDALHDVAAKYETTPDAIAIAWITRHPANMQVVIGTTNPNRVRESAAGAAISLTREEWYHLYTAAGHVLP
ncbi:aldo/keto reductase [Kribbella sp. NBC_00709]|uniref:aldo/keto reductase n=1 Tax=Kribbella sp. NBC_00709 TaxID=2975972 RepID=UPI002E29BE90|nr:aldo/keto reductase [Kribbella sp. NBC_00709]